MPTHPMAQPLTEKQQTSESRSTRALLWVPSAVARGLALFVGVFTLVSLVGMVRAAGFDENIWWIDLHWLPGPAADLLLAVAGAVLAAWAIRPRIRPLAWAAAVLAAALAAAAVYNCVSFYQGWNAGEFKPAMQVPFSLLVAVVLVGIAVAAALAPARPRRAWPAWIIIAAFVVFCGVAFPVAQIYFFGTTDYRRPAQAAVVFGAQVHDDGRPSFALSDRVDTAIALFRAGLVKKLVMSGGVGASGYNEAIVMRRMAIAKGVPPADVVVDSNGVNTNASVADTTSLFKDAGWKTVLAVSHFYHLPRIKLAYQRAGWNVFTVPARQERPIGETPRLVMREVPAFWVYYVRAVFG